MCLSNDDAQCMGIREVYYDEEGRPVLHGEPFLHGEDLAELRTVLSRLCGALELPILTGGDFVEDGLLDREIDTRIDQREEEPHP